MWDIPFLNPKAAERTGYPTQKPVLLLERIIELVTDRGDLILDPFCGSGTTLVAAQLLERNSIGIDISSDAIQITRDRLNNPIKTNSYLLQAGRDAYENVSEYALAHLYGLDITPVHRNKGIDALLKIEYRGGPVPVRVQRRNESLVEAACSLYEASKTKHASAMILIATQEDFKLYFEFSIPPEVIVIGSAAKTINKLIKQLKKDVSLDHLTALSG
ncbi:MAG: site-specific DNA-methyltransferase [Spirochaetota bacterium]